MKPISSNERVREKVRAAGERFDAICRKVDDGTATEKEQAEYDAAIAKVEAYPEDMLEG